jgi:hypothetical protein|nr:MAG TPA: hypothetical protein [Caudoviricetes sp.]
MNVPTRPEGSYPGNSDRSKERKDITPVVKARIKRESTARKVVGEIIREDARTVGETVLWDVIIPTVKNLISDTVTRGIESMLYGGDSRPRSKTSYSDYSGYSRPKGSRDRPSERHDRRSARPAEPERNEIIFDSRSDANDVIDRMSDLIDQYGQASLADLNALIGASSNFIDDNWGWTDMGSFNVRQVRDGFLLTHDEPQSLKQR